MVVVTQCDIVVKQYVTHLVCVYKYWFSVGDRVIINIRRQSKNWNTSVKVCNGSRRLVVMPRPHTNSRKKLYCTQADPQSDFSPISLCIKKETPPGGWTLAENPSSTARDKGPSENT